MKKKNVVLPLATAIMLAVSLNACAGAQTIGGADAKTGIAITETQAAGNEGAGTEENMNPSTAPAMSESAVANDSQGSSANTADIDAAGIEAGASASAENGGTGTDTDINANGQVTSPTPETRLNSDQRTISYIDADTAEQIALNHAGMTADTVMGLNSKLEADRYDADYDVTFIGSDGAEYDYDIDAVSGQIIKFGVDNSKSRSMTGYYIDASGSVSGNGNNQPAPSTNAQQAPITNAQQTPIANGQPAPSTNAQQTPIANDQPVPSTNAQQTPIANDQPAPSTNAQQTPIANTQPGPGTNSQSGTASTLSRDQIISILSSRVSGINSRSIEIELDREHGRMVYEGEFYADSVEYEFVIDAYTGEVLEWERDYR